MDALDVQEDKSKQALEFLECESANQLEGPLF